MTPRLYGSTRPLFVQVWHALCRLGIARIGTPTAQVLVALYVTGLVLLDARQTQTRVASFLPGRCHDALNRLLRVMPLSTRAVMRLLAGWAGRLGDGYLCLDDVVVEKAYARRLRWAGWTYSFAKKRKVYGLHVVVVLWCSEGGEWRIPVAFRLWRPKRTAGKAGYRTKTALAGEMLQEIAASGLGFGYVTFDTQYTAGWFTKMVGRLGMPWVGTLAANTAVVWRGQRQSVSELGEHLRLQWRGCLGLRAIAVRVYAPSYGELRLVVTRNRHGNYEYLATNELGADLTALVRRKRSRWSVETIFRDSKQYAGLGACQARVDQAMVRHVALVLVAFVVLQMLRVKPKESIAAVKERWQLRVVGGESPPPQPLRACPPELRPTT